ncbi:hypothetical protein FJV46_10575 [Arthrobacter agilis]|uniref:hypothetical protein n=1 Tax=Arthrobacter agilis TaxID=37921 RepID=UPI000F6BE4FE|nr:hypothetical protein [Arthrobacter agilis]TPV23789.1 hypothetical protein FJV46_10575 [Arthrobacter agilis]VDR32520.1 Uncharacterised protein [Arthrobacter agilis]
MLFLAHIIITAHLGVGRTTAPKVRARQAAFLEDLEFLLDNGVHEDDIALRLGYKDRQHLRTRLMRLRRRDILDRLTRARRDDAPLGRAA